MTRIDALARETDEPARSEAAKHRHVVTWTFLAVVYIVGRHLRAWVASAFRAEGINVSASLDTGRATGVAS